MDSFPAALGHSEIKPIFDDIYFVTGGMETVLMDMEWSFSRNMTIVKEGENLILINSIRLTEQGLAALDKLGNVTDVIRIGALHDRDDAFYIDRYQAKHWSMPGLEGNTNADTHHLTAEALPISDATLFNFTSSKIPEGLLHLKRHGGVLIATDALQNWQAPDEFFDTDSIQRMTQMGFFTPANIGPVWMQVAEPKKHDFDRLKQLQFKHVLCGHGEPLLNTAHEQYSANFDKLFS